MVSGARCVPDGTPQFFCRENLNIFFNVRSWLLQRESVTLICTYKTHDTKRQADLRVASDCTRPPLSAHSMDVLGSKVAEPRPCALSLAGTAILPCVAARGAGCPDVVRVIVAFPHLPQFLVPHPHGQDPESDWELRMIRRSLERHIGDAGARTELAGREEVIE